MPIDPSKFRVTPDEVHQILETDSTFVEQSDNLLPFISLANKLVTNVCAPSTPHRYSDEELTEIERWLSAHFYCSLDPRKTSESAGISTSYSVTVTLFLGSTTYGQAAMLADINGGLAKASDNAAKGNAPLVGGSRPGVVWLGSCTGGGV